MQAAEESARRTDADEKGGETTDWDAQQEPASWAPPKPRTEAAPFRWCRVHFEFIVIVMTSQSTRRKPKTSVR
jgi:hypothetical protein